MTTLLPEDETKSTAPPDRDVLVSKGETPLFRLTKVVPSAHAETLLKWETGHKTLIELRLDAS